MALALKKPPAISLALNDSTATYKQVSNRYINNHKDHRGQGPNMYTDKGFGVVNKAK